MRAGALVLVVVVACGASSSSMRRTLITDDVRVGAARGDVRTWHDAHDWCRKREWPDADEFQVCDPHPYLNRDTPGMYALVEYALGRVVAMAIIVPVPCRITGFCDSVQRSSELDALYAPGGGRLGHFATLGLHRDSPPDVPSMQRKMLDALEVELDDRYGPPTWHDDVRSAMTWNVATGEHVGLFLDGTGAWVIETHLFGPP